VNARKKRRRKRGARRRSRAPLLLLGAAIAATAGVLVVMGRDSDDSAPESISVDSASPTTPSPPATDVESPASSTDVVDTANVSAPVTVHNDALGDIAGDTVIDDYTEVAPPEVDETPLVVDPGLYVGDRIDGVLPDGRYHARVYNVFDEDQQGVNFDIPDDNGGITPHLYPAYLDQLIFVSLVDPDDPTTNVAVSPSTFFGLVSESSPRLTEWMQITVVDGAVIAAEGFVR